MIEKIGKNKGITLIVLAITIIVLLILAGVTISILSGKNGLLKKAIYAKEKFNNSSEEEETKLKEYNESIENMINNQNSQEDDKDSYKGQMVFLDHLDNKKYKFGNAAVYINNSYIAYPSKSEYRLEKDFTIDYWVYETEQNTGQWNAHLTSAVTGRYMVWIK